MPESVAGLLEEVRETDVPEQYHPEVHDVHARSVRCIARQMIVHEQ